MCTGGQKSEVDLKNPIRSKTPPTNHEARISTTVESQKQHDVILKCQLFKLGLYLRFY